MLFGKNSFKIVPEREKPASNSESEGDVIQTLDHYSDHSSRASIASRMFAARASCSALGLPSMNFDMSSGVALDPKRQSPRSSLMDSK